MANFPQRWGDYVLIRPLGSGGMGSVFLALTRDGGEDLVCVIKRLTAKTLSDEGRRKRFHRETEISRTLSYSGIARTIEAGELEGEPYIAQEYVQGRTVAQLCAAAAGMNESLSPLMVAQIGQRVASALAYAHRRDVVHRDIAPGNVMVSFDGGVSLIDFGIARRSTDLSLTATGDFIGRAVYTAPEVLERGDADARSDIYSLGVLLWELLVGRLPALGELESHPAPSSVATANVVPRELDKLIVRALDPDPERRFARAADFAEGLLQVAPGEGRSGELATFISRCYDVHREHQLLEADVEEARPLLPAASNQRPGRLNAGRRRWQARRWVWLNAFAAILVLSVIAVRALRTTPHGIAVVAPPASQPPRTGSAAPEPALSSAPQLRAVRVPPPPTAPPPAPLPTRPHAPRVSHAKLSPAPARPSPAPPGPALPPATAVAGLLDQARDSLHDGELEDAARTAREALGTGTTRQQSVAHLILGRVLLIQGQRKQAMAEFVAAIQLDPENAAASDHLASLRRKGVQ